VDAVRGGQRRFDLEDAPPAWGRPSGLTAPPLAAAGVREALVPVRGFIAYGSESGQPCGNPFCCG
jgi:hypothetical protein